MVGKMSEISAYGVALGAALGAGMACYTALSTYFPDEPSPTSNKTPKTKSIQSKSNPSHINDNIHDQEKKPSEHNKIQMFSLTQEDLEKAAPKRTSTTTTSSLNSSRRVSPRAGDVILTGIDAATTAAYKTSDMIFVYEAGDGNAVARLVDSKKSQSIPNAFGRLPNAAFVSTRAGAGRVVYGAASTREANIAVFVPSQSLQLMLPSLKNLSRNELPCVFHVTAVKLNDSLTYTTDFSGVFLIRDTGVSIVASYSPQECYHVAFISHLVAKRCNTTVAHVFDAEVVARGSGTVNILDDNETEHLAAATSPHTSSTDAISQFKALFAEMKSQFNNVELKLFETPFVAPRAVHVVVAFGAGVGQLRRAAKTSSTPIHVIQVRVYRPWSPEDFINALPLAVRQLSTRDSWSLSVACVCSRSGTQQSLVADIATTMNSNLWSGPSPRIVKCAILPETGGLSSDGARRIIHNLVHNSTGNQSLILNSPSSSEDSLATIPSIPESGSDASPSSTSTSCPSLCLWGTPESDVQGTMHTIGERLLQVSDLYHNAIVDSDTYQPLEPTLGRMILYSDSSTPVFYPDTFKTVFVLDMALLETTAVDIASCIGHGSKVIFAQTAEADQQMFADMLPLEISQAIALNQASVFVYTPKGVGAISNTADFALASLHDDDDDVLSQLSPISLPQQWQRASFVSSRSPKRFQRRLTMSSPLASTSQSRDTSPNPSRHNGPSILDEHALKWNVVFNSNGEAQENLRPEHTQVFHVKCTKNVRLTPESYARNVFHLEFDTTGTGLTYRIGDALGVFGHNDADEVQDFIDFYDLRATDFVALPRDGSEELLTIEQLLKQRLDLFGKPSQKFYAFLAHYATDSYDQKKLKWMGSDDKESFKLRQFESVTYADVLREFKSAHPGILDLIHAIPTIKPRHYSISSSMKMHPNSVHLLVVAVDWETPKGRKRYGQCTRYLAGLNPSMGDVFVTVDIKPSVCHLPADPKQPVVCAGLGTGLAPYRAFVQERTFLKSQGVELGPMSLYFGARHRSEEYLYGDDLDEAARNGVITDLRLAFSRDQKQKVYIQHLILEDKEKLAQYFKQDEGFFYMCGPTWPVPDVKNAICEGLVSTADKKEEFSLQDADDYLETLKEEGRYILEVY